MINNTELESVENKLTTTAEIDYSNLILLRELEEQEYFKVYRKIINNEVAKIKTPLGIAVDITELQHALETTAKRGRKPKDVEGHQINTASPSKLNAYYKRLCDMNTYNNQMCRRSDPKVSIKKYVDQDGYACVNLKDYILPQVKIIAKKLECQQSDITKALSKLMYSLYLQRCRRNKRQERKDKNQ